MVAQAESTGQTCAELWLERDLRLPDLRLAVEGQTQRTVRRGRESAEAPAGPSPASDDPQECQALPFTASAGQPVSWEEGRPRGPWGSPLLVTGWPSLPVVGLEPPGSPE